MKERPILFNGDMVRAILDGRKTQTRRVVKPQPTAATTKVTYNPSNFEPDNGWYFAPEGGFSKCPYGQPGDRLWVRETMVAKQPENQRQAHMMAYAADAQWVEPATTAYKKSVPSIHMPRWASRILLEITAVRVERLQDISEVDAKAEGLRWHSLYEEWGGVEPHPASRSDCPQYRWYSNPITAFKNLWQSINGPGSWDANPWVWVVEFKRIEP